MCLAAKAVELLETLKDKLNESSSNFSSRPSSPSCDCDCHYDSCGDSVDGEGCDGCYDYHEDSYGYGRNNWNIFDGWGRYVQIMYSDAQLTDTSLFQVLGSWGQAKTSEKKTKED